MKKLLFLSHGLSANGIETLLYNVLKRIDKTKYDITVIIAIDEGDVQLHEEEIISMGVHVIHAGDLDGIKKKIEYMKTVKKLLKDGKYDIIHSNMDLLNGITLRIAKKAGIKIRICHAHTSKSQYYHSEQGIKYFFRKLLQRVYYSLMKKLMVSSSTDLVACSTVAGDYFYGKKDFSIINNGIDFDRFVIPSNYSKKEMKESLNIPDSDMVLVSVGRLSWEKNILFAIEVFNELRKIRKDIKYLCIGGGELAEQSKSMVKELGLEDLVCFTGVRTDIPEILSCCDCFLMPSIFEGLPFSLIEAQIAGLRCIVSDVVTDFANVGMVKFFSLDKTAKEWAQFINSELDCPMPVIDKEKAKLFNIDYTISQLELIYDR